MIPGKKDYLWLGGKAGQLLRNEIPNMVLTNEGSINDKANFLATYPERTAEMKERFGERLFQMVEPYQGFIDWPLETFKNN
ncbi:hypothetical protein ACFLTU_01150 [Bacteroidota bacterium]